MSSVDWGMVSSMNSIFTESSAASRPSQNSARVRSISPRPRPPRPSSPRRRENPKMKPPPSPFNDSTKESLEHELSSELAESRDSGPSYVESELLIKEITPILINKPTTHECNDRSKKSTPREKDSFKSNRRTMARSTNRQHSGRPAARATSQSAGPNQNDNTARLKRDSLFQRRGVGYPGSIDTTSYNSSRRTRSESPTPSPKKAQLQRPHSDEDMSPLDIDGDVVPVSTTARLKNIIGMRKATLSSRASIFSGFGRRKKEDCHQRGRYGNQRRPRVMSERPMQTSPKVNVRPKIPVILGEEGEEEDEAGGVEILSSHRPSPQAIREGVENWVSSKRPEIEPSALIAEDVLDDRHGRRQVKCVVWKPAQKLKGAGTKFALKIAIRGKNDTHSWRLFSEKDVMSSLDSPWHTKLVNTFKTDNCLYMLMEYEPLSSVDQYIEDRVGLRPGGLVAVRFYTACAVIALEYMHKRGIVHRDIKPSNFLIDQLGYLKICDYGLSKFLKVGERTSTMLGTIPYLSPELVNEKPYDHSVDFWSLGVSCYEMAYGMSPFEPKGMLNDKEWVEGVKSNIRTGQFRLPAERVGLPARLFMKNLLNREIDTRLGADLNYQAIKKHSFFSSVDMISLQMRTSPAPPVGNPVPKAARMG